MSDGKHAPSWSGAGYTLCGMAMELGTGDVDPNNDDEQLYVVAERGEVVTCDTCRVIIDYCKSFKRYRAPLK
jgi:hypothetical protein